MLALVFAMLALLTVGVIVVLWVGWRRNSDASDLLAQQLYVDQRLTQLTAQTLQSMREAARRASGRL